jgi:hypothetical protein
MEGRLERRTHPREREQIDPCPIRGYSGCGSAAMQSRRGLEKSRGGGGGGVNSSNGNPPPSLCLTTRVEDGARENERYREGGEGEIGKDLQISGICFFRRGGEERVYEKKEAVCLVCLCAEA